MQLYFDEDFHPVFPLLHRPSFDPGCATTTAPWLLLLAVAVTGCRFSRNNVPAARRQRHAGTAAARDPDDGE